jgi:hypothetical protein
MSSSALVFTLLAAAPQEEGRRLALDGPRGTLLGKDITPDCPHAWSVSKETLSGGKQDGVEILEIATGRMRIVVCPTRGMGILRVEGAGVRLGWDSPVKEVVHPKYVNLQARGGLGWLDGFNEWMCRCGVEWAGHPGTDRFVNNVGDEATMELTLHGRTANTPASEVVLLVDPKPPHAIRLRGRVEERMFHGPKLELWTELAVEPGATSFRISDAVTNRGAQPQEFELIYHANFGAGLLEAGARFEAPVERVTPFNAHAAKGLADWTVYAGPVAGTIESVYQVRPLAGPDGRTLVMLRDRAGAKGCSMAYAVKELPCFTLWKNTAAVEDGYVTGLEPGTSFPSNRRNERKHGRVPTLAPGARWTASIDVALLGGPAEVAAASAKIAAIQGDRKPAVDPEPEKRD